MKFTLQQNKQLQKIGRKHHLRFLVLHGSYAKSTPHQRSDLDIAYMCKRKDTFEKYLKIFQDLSEVLGNSVKRELDLKPLHNVDSLFRFYVVRDGILLYGNKTEYAEFRAYAYKDYMDSFDLRRLQDILLRKSIKILSRRYAHDR